MNFFFIKFLNGRNLYKIISHNRITKDQYLGQHQINMSHLNYLRFRNYLLILIVIINLYVYSSRKETNAYEAQYSREAWFLYVSYIISTGK
jgi:hypothetical protein